MVHLHISVDGLIDDRLKPRGESTLEEYLPRGFDQLTRGDLTGQEVVERYEGGE